MWSILASALYRLLRVLIHFQSYEVDMLSTLVSKAKFGGARLGVLCMMALMAVGSAFAQDGAADPTASLDSIASAINSINTKINTVIGPAMVTLVVTVVILAIVIKIAKRTKSAG